MLTLLSVKRPKEIKTKLMRAEELVFRSAL
jgi:hypothetical protein